MSQIMLVNFLANRMLYFLEPMPLSDSIKPNFWSLGRTWLISMTCSFEDSKRCRTSELFITPFRSSSEISLKAQSNCFSFVTFGKNKFAKSPTFKGRLSKTFCINSSVRYNVSFERLFILSTSPTLPVDTLGSESTCH